MAKNSFLTEATFNKKSHFVPTFDQENQLEIFSKKIIAVNFKPTWPSNILQKIRKVPCIDFS